MKFTASLDKLAKGMTIGTFILLASIFAFRFLFKKAEHEFALTTMSVFLFIIFLIVYLLRPLNYEVTGQEVIIHRPVKNKVISRQDITSVQAVDKDMLKYSIRVFGVGGFFGYYGKFSNSKLGSMTWYATRRDHPVLLITANNKKYILTPDEPELFVKQFAVEPGSAPIS